jgi:hypothetical protein
MGLFATALLISAKTPLHTVESRTSPDREYRLFVGVDIKILHEGDFGTVTDFSHSQAQLDGSAESRIDVRTASRVRFEPITKVGRTPLTISNIETKRAYSARTDPRRQWASRQATIQAYQQDEQAKNVSRLGNAITYSGDGLMQDGTSGNVYYNPSVDAADRKLAAFEADTTAQLDEQFYNQRGKEQSGQEDALVVEALMSSPQLIVDAYVVGIARVSKDGVQKDIIFFDDLDPIGPEPRKIKVRKEGLTTGFEVLSVDLHVFREGQELVSDQSDKQFALTREEALEYLTLAHTSSHRGETMAAKPAWSLAPSTLIAAKDPSQFDYPVRVKVDERGQVTEIDENALLPDHIRPLIQDFFFVPALANGVAVASETSFNLRDFFR